MEAGIEGGFEDGLEAAGIEGGFEDGLEAAGSEGGFEDGLAAGLTSGLADGIAGGFERGLTVTAEGPFGATFFLETRAEEGEALEVLAVRPRAEVVRRAEARAKARGSLADSASKALLLA